MRQEGFSSQTINLNLHGNLLIVIGVGLLDNIVLVSAVPQSESAMWVLVSQTCPTPCNPTDCCTPGLSVHQQLPEFAQTHAH